jgi:hypothetical protein
MKMEPESEKYRKVLNILRESIPVLNATREIKSEVIKRISSASQPKYNLYEIIDFLFGWVYIGWVRRSLITVAVAMVGVFIYQQAIILKRIDYLSRQTIVTDRNIVSTSSDEVEKILMLYRSSGRKFPAKNVTISERQMKELIESVNELKIKYRDLENLIEGDPELKKLIEEKQIGNNRLKTNL